MVGGVGKFWEMYFSGCIDLLKTSLSVSSRNNFFQVSLWSCNGCEEMNLSLSGVHSSSSGGCCTRYKSGLWQMSSAGCSCATSCCAQQRWQTRLCPPMYFPNLQPIVLAEAAADVELIKVLLQWLMHRHLCSLPALDKMLMLSGWDKFISGGAGEPSLSFG